MVVDIKSQTWTKILKGKISALIINLGYNLGPVNYIICAQLSYLQSQNNNTVEKLSKSQFMLTVASSRSWKANYQESQLIMVLVIPSTVHKHYK